MVKMQPKYLQTSYGSVHESCRPQWALRTVNIYDAGDVRTGHNSCHLQLPNQHSDQVANWPFKQLLDEQCNVSTVHWLFGQTEIALRVAICPWGLVDWPNGTVSVVYCWEQQADQEDWCRRQHDLWLGSLIQNASSCCWRMSFPLRFDHHLPKEQRHCHSCSQGRRIYRCYHQV